MIVKTSERISEYMDNVEIVLINGEKEPTCASNPVDDDEHEGKNGQISGNKGRKVDSQHEEGLSSGATAGIVLSIILVIILVGVGFVLVRSREKGLKIFRTPFTLSFNNPGFEPHSNLHDDNSGGVPFSIPETYEPCEVVKRPSSISERQFQNPDTSVYEQECANPLYLTKSKDGDFQSSAGNPIYESINGHGSGNPKGPRAESDYGSLAKRKFHPGGDRNEEPLYAKPFKIKPRSPSGFNFPEAQNGNTYAQLGLGRVVQPSQDSGFEQPGYASLAPFSRNIHGGNGKGVSSRKGISSQDNFWPQNTVHPQNPESQNEKPVSPRKACFPGYPASRLADENCSKEQLSSKQKVRSTTLKDKETPVLHLPTGPAPEETII